MKIIYQWLEGGWGRGGLNGTHGVNSILLLLDIYQQQEPIAEPPFKDHLRKQNSGRSGPKSNRDSHRLGVHSHGHMEGKRMDNVSHQGSLKINNTKTKQTSLHQSFSHADNVDDKAASRRSRPIAPRLRTGRWVISQSSTLYAKITEWRLWPS